MLEIIRSITDILFPPRDTDLLVRTVSETSLEDMYTPIFVSNTTTLTAYRNPIIKALIKENKFHHNKRAAKLLGQLLHIYLRTYTTPITLLPIPLGRVRKRERGYNQVEEILEGVSPDLGQVRTDILFRAKETAKQTELPRDARQKNMYGAFACNPHKVKELRGNVVIIIDDVLTTGSTLSAAKNALEPFLPPDTTLLCVALAH